MAPDNTGVIPSGPRKWPKETEINVQGKRYKAPDITNWPLQMAPGNKVNAPSKPQNAPENQKKSSSNCPKKHNKHSKKTKVGRKKHNKCPRKTKILETCAQSVDPFARMETQIGMTHPSIAKCLLCTCTAAFRHLLAKVARYMSGQCCLKQKLHLLHSIPIPCIEILTWMSSPHNRSVVLP